MNYDKMILEMFERIVTLEERVSMLENNQNDTSSAVGEEYKTSKKYRYLSAYLKERNEFSIKLTFAEIESILQFKLADSAKKHKEFWANSTSHSIALSWLSVNYRTVEINLEEEYIVFEKKSLLPKSFPTRKILFCNIAYMPHYDTQVDIIEPKNGGSYVSDTHDALEKFNFEKCYTNEYPDGCYYGFVETKHYYGYKVGIATNTFNSLHIERIHPSAKNAEQIDGVLVVFCATDEEKGPVIVGWYKDATVYRGRHIYDGREYNLFALAQNGVCLPENERTQPAPRANKSGVGFGQSNIWYADTPESKEVVDSVVEYIENYSASKK